MQGTGKTYEVSGDTTEWEDILIKKGITTKEDVLLSKGLNPADFVPKEEAFVPTEEQIKAIQLHEASLEELDEMEEDEEFSDSKLLEAYRKRRIEEMKSHGMKCRYGDVVEIAKDEWVREVTECSNSCWVVVHLYQDSVVECRLMEETLLVLAPKFKDVKFVKIRSTQAVENWPEKNLPTLFMYHEGELKHQLMTLRQVGGKAMTPLDLEWFLVLKGVITTSELDEDPRGSDRRQVNRVTGVSSHANYGSDDEDIN